VLGDPDAGLELRPEFEERLRQTVSYVTSGGLVTSTVLNLLVVPSLYLRFGKREAWPSSSRPSAGAQR
jgi:hypothetical protein